MGRSIPGCSPSSIFNRAPAWCTCRPPGTERLPPGARSFVASCREWSTSTRRALVAGLALAPLAARGAFAQAFVPGERSQPLPPGAAAALRLSSIRVDAAPLADKGLPRFAAVLTDTLSARLRETFADRLGGGRGAAVLVARIDDLQLGPAGGNGGRRGGRGGDVDNDYMDGAGLILEGRTLLSSTPLLVSLPTSYSGAYYLPDIDARRVDSITRQFAYWLRREMGL